MLAGAAKRLGRRANRCRLRTAGQGYRSTQARHHRRQRVSRHVSEQPVVRHADRSDCLRGGRGPRESRAVREMTATSRVTLATANDAMAAAVEAAARRCDDRPNGETRLGFHRKRDQPMPPIEARSFAEPFEELRDASDAWQADARPAAAGVSGQHGAGRSPHGPRHLRQELLRSGWLRGDRRTMV